MNHIIMAILQNGTINQTQEDRPVLMPSRFLSGRGHSVWWAHVCVARKNCLVQFAWIFDLRCLYCQFIGRTLLASVVYWTQSGSYITDHLTF